jgi:hypothetical protein
MAALAQPVAQEALVEQAVRSIAIPEGIRLRRIVFDTDHSGDTAVYVMFGVSKKFELTPARVRKLGTLRRAVTDKIDELNIGRLPYVVFEDAR